MSKTVHYVEWRWIAAFMLTTSICLCRAGGLMAAEKHKPATMESMESRTLLSTTYYVSPGGSDGNAGTSGASAFKTLQKAANSVVAGDTVHVMAGTYAKGFVLIGKAGSARIRFLADPGVVINGPNPNAVSYGGGGSGGSAIILNWSEIDGFAPVTLSGFVIDGSNGSIAGCGIWCDRVDDLQILSNAVDHAGWCGIFSKYGQRPLISGNTCSNSSGQGYSQHGIYVANSTAGATVRGNTLFGNADSGLHMNGDGTDGGDHSGTITGATIEDNVIHDNVYQGINGDGVRNSLIRNNLIWGNHGKGIALYQSDASAPASGDTIVNNTVLVPTSGYWALQLRDGAVNATVFNNVLYNAAAPSD